MQKLLRRGDGGRRERRQGSHDRAHRRQGSHTWAHLAAGSHDVIPPGIGNPTTCTRAEECTSIHTQDNLKTPTNQLFSNDPTLPNQQPTNYNNPIKNHKRMGTSVACYNRAWRPGAPGNTHAKRKEREGESLHPPANQASHPGRPLIIISVGP